jgi:uncharacterized membrane protein
VGERRGVNPPCKQHGGLTPRRSQESDTMSDTPRLIRVLYIEQTPRWEYRFLRGLLEREAARIELRVLLLDADRDSAQQDRLALTGFPDRKELSPSHVVILGDVDPKHPAFTAEHQKTLTSFVRIRGGGLLVIAGRLHGPQALKGTPLEPVLPVVLEMSGKKTEQKEGFRLSWTSDGRKHPLFQLGKDEKASQDLWDQLPEIYGVVEGIRARDGAKILAVHPPVKRDKAEYPLVLEQTFENGRTLFLGIDETWRWRAVDQGKAHAKFWLTAINHLAGAGGKEKP